MRKVYIEVTVKLIVNMDEGIEVEGLIQEMDYEFTGIDGADIIDTSIEEFIVTDSK